MAFVTLHVGAGTFQPVREDDILNHHMHKEFVHLTKEVADAVVEVETSYTQSTYVDPIKTFDINSIVTEDIKLYKGNIISNAYYDFSKAEENIVYDINATYNKDSKENHWVFSCWFNMLENAEKIDNIKFSGIYLKEKTYWYVTYNTKMRLLPGDNITCIKNKFININGEIVDKICEGGYVLKVLASDALKVNK